MLARLRLWLGARSLAPTERLLQQELRSTDVLMRLTTITDDMSPVQVCTGRLVGILLLVCSVWAVSASQVEYHVPDPGHLSKAKDLLQQ
jgi:hypothetical protein